MKKTLLILSFGILFSLPFLVLSQAPEGINYQAILRDNGGNTLSSQSMGLKISIVDSSISGGAISYSETHTITTDSRGNLNLIIGNGNAVSGTLNNVNWGNGAFYMHIEADTNNSTNYVSLGTSKLVSVPYALYAKSAGSDDDWNDGSGNTLFNIKDSIGIATMYPSERLEVMGNIKTNGFIMIPGAQNGYVLVSDSNGVASWQAPNTAGLTGATGPTGADGANGATGPTGATGAQGDPASDNQTLSIANDSLHIDNGNAIALSEFDDNDWYGAGTNDINPNIAFPSCYGCAGTRVNMYGAHIEAGYKDAKHLFLGDVTITPEFGAGYDPPSQSSGILRLGYLNSITKLHNFNSQIQILSANSVPIAVKNDNPGKVSGMVIWNNEDARFDVTLGGSYRPGNHQQNWARLVTMNQGGGGTAPSGLVIGHESDNAPILFVDNDEDVLKIENKTLTLYADSSGSTSFRAADNSNSITYILPAGDGNNGYFLSTDGSGNLSWESVTDTAANNNSSSSTNDTDWIIDSSSTTHLMYSGVAGNVGIGTNSPYEKLHVNGNAKLGGGLYFGGSTLSDPVIADITYGQATMWGNPHESLKISSGGSNYGPTSASGYFGGGVGISSSYSNYWVKSQLHVNGRLGGTASPNVLKMLTLSATSNSALQTGDGVALDFELPSFGNSESKIGGSIEVIKASDDDNNTSAKMILSTTADNETKNNALTIDSTGYIGIGDITPDYKLDIELGTHIESGDVVLAKSYLLHGSGNASYPDANLTSFLGHGRTNSWHGTSNIIGLHGLGENVQTGGSMNSTVIGIKGEGIGSTDGSSGSSTAIGGHFSASGGDNNYAGIFENGNVGIGTTNPNNLLDVAGTAETQGFKMTNGASNGYILQSDASGLASWVDPSSIIDTDDGDWVQLDVNSDGSPDQLWKNSMPVGIGWQFSSGNLDKLKFAVSGDGDFDGDHVVAIRNNGNDTESGSGEDVLFLQIMNTDSDGNSSNGEDGYVAKRNNFITFAGPYDISSGEYWRYGRIEGVEPTPNLAGWATSDPCRAIDINFAATDPVSNSVLAGCYSNGGVVYASGNGDYAEWLEKENSDEKIVKTDIVGVKGGKISKITDGAEQVMVISYAPIILGAEPPVKEQHKYEQVAFMGQVPVKVYGSVKSGDYILPSGKNDGFAKAVAPENLTIEDLNKIIGRSWSNANSERNLINIVVGVKTNEWVEIMKNMQSTIDNNEASVKKIQDDLNPKIKSLENRISELELMILNQANK